MKTPPSERASKIPTPIPANMPKAIPFTTYCGNNLSSLSSSCKAQIASPETPPIAAPQRLLLKTICRVSARALVIPPNNKLPASAQMLTVRFSQFIQTSMLWQKCQLK